MPIVRPVKSLFSNTLDMRVSPLTGRDLYDEILRSVSRTQTVIQTELPNNLVVSHRQFASLVNFTEEMYNTTDRIMATPMNVMEVVVDEDLDRVELSEKESEDEQTSYES